MGSSSKEWDSLNAANENSYHRAIKEGHDLTSILPLALIFQLDFNPSTSVLHLQHLECVRNADYRQEHILVHDRRISEAAHC